MSGLITPFYVLFSLCFTIIIIASEGFTSFEDLPLDRQLSILNKPYVKSITTEVGDIFDCVDIYKQPAFHHPLLKNHKIQMKPSSYPEGLKTVNSSSSSSPLKIGISNTGGCPSGTVPIRRSSKEDLIRAKILTTNIIHPSATLNSPTSHVAVRWLPPGNANYLGATGLFNIQKPPVVDNQTSQAFLTVQSGGNPPESINAGWMVNPILYGDGSTPLTRITAVWSSSKGGCINLLCPGFVQVHKDVTVGASLMSSIYEGKQYEMKFIVFKDQTSGNWWLSYGDKGEENIGYWPGSLFTSLSNSAEQIFWGGSTSSLLNSGHIPPMGSGHFAQEGINKAAYVKELGVLDQSHKFGPPSFKDLQFVTDKPNCYNTDAPFTGVGGDLTGFFYGGPGGNC